MKTITQQTLVTNYRYNRQKYSLGMDKFWTTQLDCSFLTVSAGTQFVQTKCWKMHFATSVSCESGKIYAIYIIITK